MTPWCRENIPVEGNFGQLFDRLNVSVDLLSREFSTELAVEVRPAPPILQHHPREELRVGWNVTCMSSHRRRSSRCWAKLCWTNSSPTLSKHPSRNWRQRWDGCWTSCRYSSPLPSSPSSPSKSLTFTFISLRFTPLSPSSFLLCRAFGYLGQYKRDICFDNVYITTYFRQIDARRRKAVSFASSSSTLQYSPRSDPPVLSCAAFRGSAACCLWGNQRKTSWSTPAVWKFTPKRSNKWCVQEQCEDSGSIYLCRLERFTKCFTGNNPL